MWDVIQPQQKGHLPGQLILLHYGLELEQSMQYNFSVMSSSEDQDQRLLLQIIFAAHGGFRDPGWRTVGGMARASDLPRSRVEELVEQYSHWFEESSIQLGGAQPLRPRDLETIMEEAGEGR